MDLEQSRQIEHKKRIKIGYTMALFCAVLWGLWYLPGEAVWVLEPFDSMWVAIDATHGESVALVVIAALITGLNALTVLLALLLWNGALGKFKEMKRTIRQIKPCTRHFFFASIFGGPMAILGSFIAIGFIGGGFAAVAALLYPVVGTLVSVKWGGQRITQRALAGISMIVLGGIIIYIIGAYQDLQAGGSLIGYLGGAMAALGWGIEGAVAGKALDISEPDIGITLRFLAENVLWWIVIIPALFIAGFPMYEYAFQIFEPVTLLILSMMGLTFGFCYVSWYKSFPLIGVGRGQGIANLYGLFAVIFIFLFLGWEPTWTVLIGGSLCIIGSLVMYTEEPLELESLRG